MKKIILVVALQLVIFSTVAYAYSVISSTNKGNGDTEYYIKCDNGRHISLMQDSKGAIYGTNNGSYFMRNGSSLDAAARSTCGE